MAKIEKLKGVRLYIATIPQAVVDPTREKRKAELDESNHGYDSAPRR